MTKKISGSEFQADRRFFLKTSAIAGGGIGFGYFNLFENTPSSLKEFLGSATPFSSHALAQSQSKQPDNPASFIKINSSNKVEIVVNRLEFGQGISTALPLILADEMDMPIENVTSSLGGNNPAYNDPFFGMHMTGGSNSIHNSYMQYRTIGATARAMFIEAASKKWNVPASKIKTKNGLVFAAGKEAKYSELIEEALKLPVPQKVDLKKTKDFKLIGKPTKRLDSKTIVNGTKEFGIDFNKEGALVAVVARPPGFNGGEFVKYDSSKSLAIKGVKAVVEVPLDKGGKGIAIVATGYWPAKQARDALIVEWKMGGSQNLDSEKLFEEFKQAAEKPELTALDWKGGVTPETLSKAKDKISATFTFPYLAHAALEPLNCTIEMTEGKCEVWGATQMPGVDTMALAKFTNLKPEQIIIHTLPSGGGFGRRAVPTSEFVLEAAGVSGAWKTFLEKNKNKPEYAKLSSAVKTIWSREDDMRGGYYRPMHVHKAEIGFDEKGNILAWDHVVVGQSILKGSPFEAMMVKNGVDATMTEGLTENVYNLPLRVRLSHPSVNVPVLWWRSVGHTHTAYVTETLVDEIARKLKKDPVAFRLEKLDKKTHARSRAALELAVKKSGYSTKKLPAERAYGVAVHESFRSAVAYVVEVSIEKGKPVVHKVTAGVHCNKVVNPLTAKTQIEGGMNFGLSMLMPGAQITLKNGSVVQNQYTEFTVTRLSDAPKIVDVHFVPSEDNPTGLGEPGTPPILPAVANAIASLTGKYVRNMPKDWNTLS
jgi:isoquinoline 1-oxidoreductase subunit beta